MKHLSFIILMALCFGCRENKPKPVEKQVQETHYPKAVYNSCTHKWAVETRKQEPYYDYRAYFGDPLKTIEPYYHNPFPIPYLGWKLPDSSEARLGQEFQFNSEFTALKSFMDFEYKRSRRITIADSLSRRENFVQDSIFKCQHTYK